LLVRKAGVETGGIEDLPLGVFALREGFHCPTGCWQ